MAKVNENDFFDSGPQFLKGADIKDGQVATVEGFEAPKTSIREKSPLLRLKGIESPLGLNKTNFRKMVEKFGDDVAKWSGKKIKLRKVQAPNPQQGGKLTAAIRIE